MSNCVNTTIFHYYRALNDTITPFCCFFLYFAGGHSHNLNSSMRADFSTLNSSTSGGGNNNISSSSAHAGQHYSEDSDSST